MVLQRFLDEVSDGCLGVHKEYNAQFSARAHSSPRGAIFLWVAPEFHRASRTRGRIRKRSGLSENVTMLTESHAPASRGIICFVRLRTARGQPLFPRSSHMFWNQLPIG